MDSKCKLQANDYYHNDGEWRNLRLKVELQTLETSEYSKDKYFRYDLAKWSFDCSIRHDIIDIISISSNKFTFEIELEFKDLSQNGNMGLTANRLRAVFRPAVVNLNLSKAEVEPKE